MVRRLAEFGVTAALCLAGARLGLWFVPFVAGVWFGAPPLGRGGGPPRRGTVLTAAAAAVAGWAVSLWQLAWAGLPAGATARTIAALAGLPPYAAVTVAVTLLLAALQVLAGGWLARATLAVLPRGQAAAQPRGQAAAQPQGQPPPLPPGGTAQDGTQC